VGKHEPFTTTYRSAFPRDAAYNKPVFVKAKPDNIRVSAPFVSSTTNQNTYMWNGFGDQQKPALSVHGRKTNAFGSEPFQGITTSHASFPNWRQAKPRKAVNMTTFGTTLNLTGDTEQRDFLSESRRSFNRTPIPIQRIAHTSRRAKTPKPFFGTTTNAAAFQPRAYQAPIRVQGVRQREMKHLPEQRNFLTETKQQYTKKQAAPCPAIPIAVATKLGHGHVTVEQLPNGTWRHNSNAPL
jgi:hypothetical protein